MTHWTINRKIIAGFAMVMAAAGSLGLFSIYLFHHIASELALLTSQNQVPDLSHLSQTVRMAAQTVAVIGLVGTLISLVCAWWVIRSLGRTLRIIAAGLQDGALRLRTTAVQVASASQSLASGAGEQAASLEETSASLEEVSSMTRRNAQNVRGAKEFTLQTRSSAEAGVELTHEMERATQGIRSASVEMRDAMEGIKTASGDVSKIIKKINEIAFQTNILALNAAVEAARAGEAGMGFAVVADEVRNLAQRSAGAARETTELIEASLQRSEDAVLVTEKVSLAVEQVASEAHQLETKLSEILTRARQVDEQMGQIALASQEQNQGISQVTAAVNQMDRVTQRTAANAEENSSAADALKNQAQELNEVVEQLLHLTGTRMQGMADTADSQAASFASSGLHSAEDTASVRQTPAPVADQGEVLIQWDPSRMSTGEASIDEQHQELIGMINRLHKACLAGTGKAELHTMMGFMADYVHKHFAHEEGLMEEKSCPTKEKNKLAHAKFLSNFTQLMAKFEEQGPTTPVLLELRNLVGGWLTNHICSIDTKLRGCQTKCPKKALLARV